MSRIISTAGDSLLMPHVSIERKTTREFRIEITDKLKRRQSIEVTLAEMRLMSDAITAAMYKLLTTESQP